MTLNYKSFGSGTPLIILHGLFGMLDNWHTFARQLQDFFTIYIVDLRNHGKSFKSTTFSYPSLARDIIHFMDEHDIASAYILGHSMGGKVAISLAQLAPDRILKLIVVDIGIKSYPAHHKFIFDSILPLDIANMSSRQEVDTALSPSITDKSIRQFLLKNLQRRPQGGFQWKANFDILYQEYEHIMAGITISRPIQVPVLFVRGLKSRYITDVDILDLQSKFEHFELLDIQAGHWIHAEQPQLLRKGVISFLT